MAALDKALTTLARAKSFLEISGTSKDLVLTMLIKGASEYIERTYCRRTFGRTTYTNQVINGKDSKRLWLKNKPIIGDVTLQVRTTPNNEDAWQSIEAQNFYINRDAGNLELLRHNDAWLGLGGTFKEGVQNYRVTYTAGYYLPKDSEFEDGTDDEYDLPADLELAVLDLVSAVYNVRQSGGIKSQEVGDVSITYGNELEKHPTIKKTLDKYRTVQYA